MKDCPLILLGGRRRRLAMGSRPRLDAGHGSQRTERDGLCSVGGGRKGKVRAARCPQGRRGVSLELCRRIASQRAPVHTRGYG